MIKKRRGNNEGCIYQRGGRWVAMVNMGHALDGKRIRKTIYGDTRAEVAIKMTTLLNDRLNCCHVSVTNDCFEALMTEWLLTFKKATITARTFEKNINYCKNYVFPSIGDKKLADINAPMLQRLLNNLIMRGYALDTVKKVKCILRQFFEYAVDSEFAQKNPLDKVKLQARERKTVTDDEYKAIPEDMRNKFMTAISSSKTLKPICFCSLLAGLRIGEVLALKWSNLDFANKTISVENALTVIPKFDKQGKTLSRETVISDTKTAASMREVPMPQILADALKEWQALRKVHETDTGKSFTAQSDLVFSNEKGELRTYYGTRTLFNKLMKKHELTSYGFHFHSLRHTYSSMLFEAGENPKVIQMLMGHKDVTTTIRTYNSVDRSYFKQATDKLNAKFMQDKSDKE